MGNKLLLGLLIAIYALPASADIYMGTDATPPASYQSSTNYPNNVATSGTTAPTTAAPTPTSPVPGNQPASTSSPAVVNSPASTSSPVVVKVPTSILSPTVANPPASPSSPGVVNPPAPTSSPAVVKAPTPTPSPVVKASAPTPAKNDQAAQQQPLAHVDTTTTTSNMKPPLNRPAGTSVTATTAIKPASAPVVVTPAVLPPPPPPKPLFTTVALPGSLKDNVERIVAQSHWGTVVWNLPIDYNWSGTMTINAPDVQEAIAQLLAHYPVQATFYEKNHIVSIEARRAI